MKIYCNGLDLSDALLKVMRAMPVKKNIPILEGIKLSAAARELTLTATDLALSIETKIKADVMVEGEIVIPGKDFGDVIRKLTGETLELDATDGTNLMVRYGDNSFKIKCMNIDEYPPIREVSEDMSFSILSKEFKDLIRKINYAVATDDIRPILKGCLMEVDDYKITGVALDGFRMAVCNKALEKKCGNFSVVVPSRCLDEIAKLLDDDGISTVCLQKNYLMLDMKHTKITSRLIEGEFIQYKKIIPHEFSVKVTVNREQMLSSLERVSQVSRGDKNNLVKFDVKEKLMNITSNSDISDINENVIIGMEGKDIKIAFNVRYFLEFLNSVEDEFIKINFSSSTAPCIITPAEGDEYTYLVLPVKVSY
ncbi:MAG: DNA polymerase III subunit beta [Christensenellales bacterium]